VRVLAPSYSQTPMSQVHRFVPQRGEAKKENIVAAVLGFFVGPALLYFSEGVRSWPVLIGAGVGVAALILVGYTVRGRIAWIDAIELSPEGATLETKGERRTLAWTNVKGVRHGNRGGVHWSLSPRGAHPTMMIRGDGLSTEECRQITELINAYIAEASSPLVRA
jgi:hypothetical protein